MRPRVGALLAVVFWGLSFVATKAAVREISPLALIFLRAGLGTMLIAVVLVARGQRLLPPRQTWRALAVMGFVGVAFHQLLQAHALTMTTAVHTGWLIGLTPVWSALLARMVLGERFSAIKSIGLLLGFAGAALVVTQGRLGVELLRLPSTQGDLLILLSTLNWAVYSVIGHPTLKRIGATAATAGAMAAGWLMLAVPFVAAGAWRHLRELSAPGWGAVAFLGLCCSGLGYLLWYGALEKVEASRVASLLYLEPLVTLAAGVLLLGESISLMTAAGGALLLLGVGLVQAAPAVPDRAST